MKRIRCAGLAALSALTLRPVIAASPDGGLEEIIVTATKREA